MVVHIYNPRTCDVEAGGSGFQDPLWLHNAFQASLALYVTLTQKKNKEKEKKCLILGLFRVLAWK